MTIDYIPGTTSNLVGDPAEGGAFSSGNKGEIAGANTAAANAATSATAAAASATAASQSASDLSSAETNASTSATAAANSASAAASDRSATQGYLGSINILYNSFEASYLGSKTGDPSFDNDGNALAVGALYYNSTLDIVKVWSGSQWNAAAVDGATILLKAQNLADLPSASTARTNLGLGTMALETASSYAPLAGATFTGDVTAPEFIGTLQGNTVFKAKAGESILRGDALYVSGVSGNTPVVKKADANGASTYPAFGLAAATTANNGLLDVITAGQLTHFDTSGFSLGDTLYLSETPGLLTATPPSGEGSIIQNMGKVEREHASVGAILVVGSGRTAATPNLNDGNIFIGNSSNKAATSSFNTLTDARIDAKFIDEDDFSTNSATRSPSQQSVKAYVAAQTANIQGDITNVVAQNGLIGGGTSGAVQMAVNTTIVATTTNTLSMNNKTLNTPVLNSPDINGGTMDGVVIGGSTAAAATFTTVNSGDITITDGTPALTFVDSGGTNVKTEQVQTGGTFVTTVQNDTSHGSIDFKSNDGTDNKLRMRIGTNGDLNHFLDDGTTLGLKFDASQGRLGIGTNTTLGAAIDVEGNILVRDANPSITLNDTDGGQNTELRHSGNTSFLTSTGPSGNYGETAFRRSDGTTTANILRFEDNGHINFFKDNGSNGMRFTGNTGFVGIGTTNPDEKLHVDGNIKADGIVFNSETQGTGTSVDSNTLEDYERGTFTPTLFDKNATDGNQAVVGTSVGEYTKVGNLVHCTINLSNIDTTTNSMVSGQQLHIHGLPFTSSASRLVPIPIYSVQVDVGTSIAGVFGIFGGNGNFIQLRIVFEGGGTAALDVSSVNNTSADMHLAFQYQTSE